MIMARSLLIDDHTKIMIAILENAHSIFHKSKSKNMPPNIHEALTTLLDEKISDDVKYAIEIVLPNLPKLDQIKSQISNDDRNIIKNISENLEKSTDVQNMIEILGMLRRDYPKNQNMQKAISYSIDILNAGSDSIYNEKYLSNFKISNSKSSLKEYCKVDANGSIVGAVSLGTVVGIVLAGEGSLPGIGVASVCGAVEESGRKFLTSLWDRMRGN